MTPITDVAVAGTALLVCKHAPTRDVVIEGLQSLAIHVEICDEVLTASGLLERQKFEAVIVDLLLGEDAFLLVRQLRFSRSNRTAVTFAITAGETWSAGVRPNSTFVLERPLSAGSVNQTLRAAYGLVVRERRRYFRCPLAVPGFIRAGQLEEFLCQTVNISEGGVAIIIRTMPESTLPAAVRFSLPGSPGQLETKTKVCWRGHGGLVGLEFQFLTAPQKEELQEWLARKLDETLPENVAALFRSVGQ